MDPGMYYARERDAIVRLLDSLSLKPKGIINTHAHLDHIFGVKFLVDKYQLTFGLHHKEKEVLDYAVTSAAVFGIDFPEAPVPDYFIESGKDLALGDDTVSVLHCPGHSPGSIVFI